MGDAAIEDAAKIPIPEAIFESFGDLSTFSSCEEKFVALQDFIIESSTKIDGARSAM